MRNESLFVVVSKCDNLIFDLYVGYSKFILIGLESHDIKYTQENKEMMSWDVSFFI